MTNKTYISRFILLLSLLVLIQFVGAETVTRKVSVNLYGHTLRLDITPDLYQLAVKVHPDKTTLSALVVAFTQHADRDSLLKQLDAQASLLKMDDIAYVLLLNKVADQLFKKEGEDLKTVFKYTLLGRKGFDVVLGYSDCSITLYGRTNFLVDNCLFIEKNNRRYFDLSFSQSKEFHEEQALESQFIPAKRYPLVMNMIHPPAFGARESKKVIPFEYDGFTYFFTCNINQSLVDYYKELPTINISTVYLNYGLSEGARKSLVKEIRNATANMGTAVVLDFLLKFTQSAFEYKKDEEVYGQEKFSFPEETLCNRFSDCEDKAMLFAYLLNETLGLKTVALYYRDAKHINVAVENWTKNQPSSFRYQDQQYIICEPSGNGFSAGESSTANSFASLIDW